MRLPNVGEYVRNHGKLVKIETIPPPPQPPPTKEYIFEEIEARGEFRLNGEVIETFSTFNDYYGRESSVETATKDMKEYAEERKIGPKSECEVVVVRVVSQVRLRPLLKENFRDKEFCDFDYLERGSKCNVPDPVESIVWSSRGELGG